MSPPTSGKHSESGTARVLGSGASGIAELLVFHPVDTIAKRLMSNKSNNLSYNAVIFRNHADAPLVSRFFSLFPGLGYAAGYKISQRIYKFGGQPYFNDLLRATPSLRNFYDNTFGERRGKMLMHATAGSLTGIGEVVLLPLDALKIKRQVNPEAFRNRGFLGIIREEGHTLYRGWGWTMARNAPGSFALFGASAATKEYILKIEDYSKATWSQNFVASVAGAVASITVAAPLDTVKTRIQNANFETKVPGMVVIRELVKNEGPFAFFKGLTPKILVVGPKLVFSFTLAQTLIPAFGKYV